MLCYQVTFDESAIKDCLNSLETEEKDGEKYFLNLKEKKINEIANKTNEDFNRLIDEICSGIDNIQNIYMIKKIGTALNKLNSLSKRLYNAESEILNFT